MLEGFGKLTESLSIPNLIEVQKNSYKQLADFDSQAGELTKVLIEFLKVFSQLKI